jgi:serine/threonine-protein kinase
MKPGEIVGIEYELVRLVGRDGIGAVYDARHSYFGHTVTVRLVRQELSKTTDSFLRYFEEARLATKLESPYIATALSAGRTQVGANFLVLEHLNGRSLADLLRQEGHLAIDRAAAIAIEICQALTAAHEQGLYHRALRTQSIYLVRDESGKESVKIIDFGYATLADAFLLSPTHREALGVPVGAPHYVAPEQARLRKGEYNPQRDLYSVGVVLYEMLVGRVPFAGSTYEEVLYKAKRGLSKPLEQERRGISPSLARVVLNAMAADPEQRPIKALHLATALAPFATVEAARLVARNGTNGNSPKAGQGPSTGPQRTDSEETHQEGRSATSSSPDAPHTVPLPPGEALSFAGEQTMEAGSDIIMLERPFKAESTDPLPTLRRGWRRSKWLVVLVLLGLVAGLGGSYAWTTGQSPASMWSSLAAWLGAGEPAGEEAEAADAGGDGAPLTPADASPNDSEAEAAQGSDALQSNEGHGEVDGGAESTDGAPSAENEAAEGDAARTEGNDEVTGDQEGEPALTTEAQDALTRARAHHRGRRAQKCIDALEGLDDSQEVVTLKVKCLAAAGKRPRACYLAKRHPDIRYVRRWYGLRCRRQAGAAP